MIRLTFFMVLFFSISVQAQENQDPVATTPESPQLYQPQVPQAQVAEPQVSQPASQPQDVIQPPVVGRKGLKVGIHFNTASKAKFDKIDAYVSNTYLHGDGEFNTEGAFGIDLEYFHHSESQLTFQTGLSYELPREIKSGSYTLDGISFSGSYSDPSTVALLIVYANLVYKAQNNFYIPFGLNLTHVNYNQSTDSDDTEITGGLGIQFGIGFNFNEFVSGEILYKSVGIKAETKASPDYIKYEEGRLSGTHFGLKFAF